MSVKSVNYLNTVSFTENKKLSNGNAIDINNGSAFKVYDTEKQATTKAKIGVALTTVASVAFAYAMILKHKGVLTNPFKTPIKDWGIFKVIYEEKAGEIANTAAKAVKKFEIFKGRELESVVTALALTSVGGGLVGGRIFDKKENMYAKYRESVIQLIGNVFTPLACVSIGMRGFENYEEPTVRFLKFGEKTKGIPKVLISGICLLAGIFLGNKVGNTLNEKCFGVKDNRKLRLSDMSPHIDELCIATSLIAAKGSSSIGAWVSRIIPMALIVPGLTVGTTQEKPDIAQMHEQNNKEQEKREN